MPGPFVRFLAGASGLLCVLFGAVMTFSHPLGIFVAGLLVCGWFFFLRLLAFLSDSGELAIYEVEETEKRAEEPLDQGSSRLSEISHQILAEKIRQKQGDPPDRILRQPGEEPPSPLVKAVREGRISQPQLRRYEDAEKKEEQEWADMFRAL